MNKQEKLCLNEMLRKGDAPETTQLIQKLKHSKKIKKDILQMNALKRRYKRLSFTNKDQYRQIMVKQCNFIFNHYTNIFNRLLKDQLDMNILMKFVSILERIENGDIDQHHGSFEVGKILKSLYVDSVLRQEKQMPKDKKKKIKKPKNNISWRDFKKMKIDYETESI